jgi:uncharacterized membrane protein YtjA (UPF0391 family)
MRWAVLFLIIALVSGAVALSGLSLELYWIARTCFLLFLVAFVVTAAASAVWR